MDDAVRARALLREGNTLALVKGEEVKTSIRGGIAPLLELVESGCSFTGYAAADKIVGKAAAMLYILLGVGSVYAEVASESAKALLEERGVAFSCGQLAPAIVNRKGDGLCPMEKTVLSLTSPEEAPRLLRETLERLRTASAAETHAEKKRCNFGFGAERLSSKSVLYHDTRWCKPEHRDGELFAMLVLEGMQAGVSWNLILEKEENFRRAFDGFDPQTVALYGEEKVAELLQNKGIIRNRSKIRAAISNAQAFLKVKEEFGSFDAFIWSFTEGKPVDHRLADAKDMPAKDGLSERISAELKKRGFKFVGPVIVYSYLQGIGVINDHTVDCDFR